MKNVMDFQKKKRANEKITMVTCYDYSSACIVNDTNMDCVLVGDSVAMVVHGYPNTFGATLEMMLLHTQAVAKGLHQFLITDMPFMVDRKSLGETMSAVEKLVRAGAQAIKMEEAEETQLQQIRHIVRSGIPVMGHLGFTMQYQLAAGGFHVKGKMDDSKNKLIEQAKKLEDAGCFAIVLECIPPNVATHVTQALSIPTIGIGAGSGTDGQVLVFQDLLGLQTIIRPRFVKRYLEGKKIFQETLNHYVDEVANKKYPSEEYCY